MDFAVVVGYLPTLTSWLLNFGLDTDYGNGKAIFRFIKVSVYLNISLLV